MYSITVTGTPPPLQILPRILTRAEVPVQLTTQVCAFRAPMLTSVIHSKYGARFAASTTHLLQLQGWSWADVWLTPEERATVEGRAWEGLA